MSVRMRHTNLQSRQFVRGSRARNIDEVIVVQTREQLATIDDGAATRVAQALVDESLRKGTQDNITAVVLLNAWS